MRSCSSSINTILNQSNNSSNKSSGISRKPTSALSKIGKHVPPPISPIIAFKSTTSSTTTAATSSVKTARLVEDKTSTSALATNTTTTTTTTCAWRIPKVATEPPVVKNYPQRKVPELTPVPVAVKEPEKPKGFLERFEEFPNLLKQQQQPSLNTTNTTALPLPPQRPPQKLLGGDFNFLEDDDWLDGDNIDYSQNLFEDDNHFLPSYILEETIKTQVDDKEIETNNNNSNSSSGLCHVKAKSLLSERHHSSKKKDIWKRTDEQEQERPKMKIKILKRLTSESKVEVKEVKEEHGVATTTIVPATEQLVKKFSTNLKLHETAVEELKQQSQSQLQQPQQPQPQKKPLKIVYSSASKTLQKM